jgi:hypothetical protein
MTVMTAELAPAPAAAPAVTATTTITAAIAAAMTLIRRRIQPYHILRLETLGFGDYIELDPLALMEGLETATLDCTVMDKDIRTIILGEESEPLLL